MGSILVLKEDGLFEKLDVKDNNVDCHTLQKIVGGYIEHVTWNEELLKRNIDMWVNEEGKLLDMKPNVVFTDDGTLVEVICGPVAFTRFDSAGNSLPLNDDDIDCIKHELSMVAYLNVEDFDIVSVRVFPSKF